MPAALARPVIPLRAWGKGGVDATEHGRRIADVCHHAPPVLHYRSAFDRPRVARLQAVVPGQDRGGAVITRGPGLRIAVARTVAYAGQLPAGATGHAFIGTDACRIHPTDRTPSAPMQTALIVTDVQRGLFDDTPRPAEADAVLGRINRLISRARAAARACGVRPARAARRRDAVRLGRVGAGAEPVRAGGRPPHTQDHAGFFPGHRARRAAGSPAGESIGDLPRASATEFCADTTTRRAAGLGYAITLAADAHTTHDKPHASAGLIRCHR
ncbi:hypothetical protein ACU4GD_28780 [Cupriavidus basilensis]